MTDLQFDFIKSTASDIEEVFPTISSDVCLFIACQFALESDYGQSELAKFQNNYCGMRNPMVRPSTSIVRSDSSHLFAFYTDKFMCIVDYFLCLCYHIPLAKDLESLDLFTHFIKWYCPKRSYIEDIMKVYKSFKSYQNGERK